MSEMYEYQQLKVTELLLNSENPRFNPVKHQTEAIDAMIEDQGEKLITLAQHIHDHGLNPTDRPLIFPYEKQWLVLEGNRRITVLKLVNEPNLVPKQYTKIKSAFQKLNKVFNSTLFESIPCVIVHDREEANEWIRLKHTGQNDGSGTVGWDGQQTSRFKTQTSGNIDARLVFFDKLKDLNSIPQNYKDDFANVKKTNFDRLMSDPDVRELLGISTDSSSYSLIGEAVNPYFLAVLYDLIFDDLSVGKIYHKDDRKRYIEEIRTRVGHAAEMPESPTDTCGSNSANETEGDLVTDEGHPPLLNNRNNNSIGTDNGSTNGVDQTSETSSTSPSRGFPMNRKTIVPSQSKLTIQQPRINSIFKELKSLNIELYPNAGAVLFRAFIELSGDHYIKKNELNTVNVDSRLVNKIDAIVDDLKNKSIMTDHELKPARQMAKSPTQNISIKTFHAYVHNMDYTPIAADLKSAWNDIWPFIKNIWS